MNGITKKEIALLLAILLLGGLLIGLQWGDPVDDAYVSFVYAKNLTQGQGLTFNPGERVEGYSNFTWVMILAALHGIAPIPQAAQALGFALGIGNILLIFFISRRCGLGAKSLIVAAIYASDLRAAVWSVEGLETPLYVFLILLTILLYLRNRSRGLWAIPSLLAAMTRPEGAAVFLAVALHRALVLYRSRKRPDGADWIAAAIFCVLFLIYNAWRSAYFGSLLPNTYYARGGANGPWLGLLYIALTLSKGWGLVGALPLIAILIIGIMGSGKDKTENDGVLASWLLMGTAIVLATGGDWMPNGRFIVPILPIVYLYCLRGAERIRLMKAGYVLLAVVFAMNLLGDFMYDAHYSFEKRWSRNQASFYMPVADWLNERKAAGEKTVLSDVGYITYYSHIHAIDTLGLTNRRLARVPGGSAWATDLDYVFSENPRYIIRMERDYGNGGVLGHTAFDREVITDSRFKNGYREVAAIPGYDAVERSLGDLKRRSYRVTFRIYERAKQ